MSLPIEWIDKIFLKLTLNYGTEFLNRYKGQDMGMIKSDWCHELTSFGKNPAAISHALSNLPERPPTAQSFKALCYQGPKLQEAVAAIPDAPKADPERVRAELAKLADVQKVDHKAWARTILRDVAGGLKRNPTVVLFARQALGEVA